MTEAVWLHDEQVALGIDPFGYLRDALDRVCTHPARRISELLPDRLRAARSGSAFVEAD